VTRLLHAVRVRARVARHRGNAVHCPLCDKRFDRFREAWNRPNALCWRCGAHERHRAQWLLFERRPQLLAQATSLLHFSPEWCLRERLSALSHLRYVTTDLDPAQAVELRLDVTATGLADGAFDAVICSHVLEHVPDDATAMGELRRITAPGGWCLVMVPLALDRGTTYEDASITAAEDRRREFLQHDHVRLYAPDVAGRLRHAGFTVETIDTAAELGPDGAARHGLLASDLIFLCRPA
jgi:SAM-dependent methyltransferase